VEAVSPGRATVLPTVRRDVILVVSAVVNSCCCGEGGSFGCKLFGVVLFGDVAVGDGKHLGRGNKNCLLRCVT
jgi:hypothetical protein